MMRESRSKAEELLRRLRTAPGELTIEVDACSPRMPRRATPGPDAVRMRMRDNQEEGWLTADWTSGTPTALVQLDGTQYRTGRSGDLEAMFEACREERELRPPAAELALLLEIGDRLDAIDFLVTSRDRGGETATARMKQPDLLSCLARRTWPLTAPEGGWTWALPARIDGQCEWLTLNSNGHPTVRHGRSDLGLHPDEIRTLDRVARTLLAARKRRPTGRWAGHWTPYVVRAARSRRAGR